MIFLIDGDNNVNTGINGIELLTKDDTVLIFHHKSMVLNKLMARARQSQANVRFIESVMNAKNSIDFQIVAELGILIGRGDVDCAYIISHDKDYEPPIESLRARYSDCFCEIGLRDDIESCLKFAYVLRAKTADELVKSLVSECGESWGNMLYTHLKNIFTSTPVDELPTVEMPADESVEATAQPETAEEAASAPVSDSEPQGNRSSRNSRRRRGGRRGDRRRDETVEKSEPAIVEVEAVAEAEVAEEPIVESVEAIEEQTIESEAEAVEEIEVEIYEEPALEQVVEATTEADIEPTPEPEALETIEPILEVVIEPTAEVEAAVVETEPTVKPEPASEKPKRSRRGRKPKSEQAQPTEATVEAGPTIEQQPAESTESIAETSAEEASEQPKASRRKSRPRRKKVEVEAEVTVEDEQGTIPEPEELPELPLPDAVLDVE